MARNFQRIQLKYDTAYYRDADTAMQIPDIRAEYTRLRKIEMERLRAIKKAGYADTETYRYNKGRYDKPSTLSDTEIAERLPDLARAIMAKGGTIGGIRRIEAEQLETLRDEGYDFLNKRNIRYFGKFMEDMKASEDSARWYQAIKNEDAEARIMAIQERFAGWLQTEEL